MRIWVPWLEEKPSDSPKQNRPPDGRHPNCWNDAIPFVTVVAKWVICKCPRAGITKLLPHQGLHLIRTMIPYSRFGLFLSNETDCPHLVRVSLEQMFVLRLSIQSISSCCRRIATAARTVSVILSLGPDRTGIRSWRQWLWYCRASDMSFCLCLSICREENAKIA